MWAGVGKSQGICNGGVVVTISMPGKMGGGGGAGGWGVRRGAGGCGLQSRDTPIPLPREGPRGINILTSLSSLLWFFGWSSLGPNPTGSHSSSGPVEAATGVSLPGCRQGRKQNWKDKVVWREQHLLCLHFPGIFNSLVPNTCNRCKRKYTLWLKWKEGDFLKLKMMRSWEMLHVSMGWIFQPNVFQEQRANQATREECSGPKQKQRPSSSFPKLSPPFWTTFSWFFLISLATPPSLLQASSLTWSEFPQAWPWTLYRELGHNGWHSSNHI